MKSIVCVLSQAVVFCVFFYNTRKMLTSTSPRRHANYYCVESSNFFRHQNGKCEKILFSNGKTKENDLGTARRSSIEVVAFRVTFTAIYPPQCVVNFEFHLTNYQGYILRVPRICSLEIGQYVKH